MLINWQWCKCESWSSPMLLPEPTIIHHSAEALSQEFHTESLEELQQKLILWNLAWKKRDSRSVCSMEGKSWGRTGSGALPLGFNSTIPAQFFPIYSHPPSFLYFLGGTPHQKLWLFPHAHLTPLPIFHQKPPYPHPLTPSKHKAVDSYPFVSHQADHTFHTSISKYELEYPDIQC